MRSRLRKLFFPFIAGAFFTLSALAQSKHSFPEPAADVAYACNGTHLLIQGGIGIKHTPSTQFFSLDLTHPWTDNSPLWRNLSASVSPPTVAGLGVSGTSGTFTSSGEFLVSTARTGVPSSGLYKYSNATWASLFPGNQFKGFGPIISTEATTGQVYFFGDKSSMTPPASLRSEPSLSLVDNGYAVGWSSFMKGFLSTYYDNNGSSRGFAVRRFIPTEGQSDWEVVDGSKFYLFGGANADESGISDDLYILDVRSMNWTLAGTPSTPQHRVNMACAVAGDTLVIWGGYRDLYNNFASASPLLYNAKNNTWVATFTPQVQPQPTLPTDHPSFTTILPPSPTLDDAKSKPSASNKVAIIAGAVGGGVALLILLIIIVCLCRRRREKQRHNGASASGHKPGPSGSFGSNENGRYVTIPSPFVSDSHYELETSVPRQASKTPRLPHIIPSSPFPAYISPEERAASAVALQHQQGQNRDSLFPPTVSSPLTRPPAHSKEEVVSANLDMVHGATSEEADFTGYAQATSSRDRSPGHYAVDSSNTPMSSRHVHGADHDDDTRTSYSDISSEQGTMDLLPITQSEAGSYISRGNSFQLSRAPTIQTHRSIMANPPPSIPYNNHPSHPHYQQRTHNYRRDSGETTDLDYLEPATY
ncbi:hypothetical protein BG004_002923 [Podila humilis]|nr:hypothetical protein BG004_002923 [Podila humilis]